ncbi:lytic transglycosylase domain-containing protein [Paenibacillus sp. JX-17]|uniref:Lytic transglycosylase domain-containing protein n=1 Tax=Paenibacillus lacisoli TaxID=3064525 RepID=A0ABT9C850_9BACL|nr:lytic transglycosylase domain-containing protein [Paenibacillus sp. JX-17]MDO7905435.1 lytic transglycosylase domain-containing protein [Paenibacillus sp. JX-17]
MQVDTRASKQLLELQLLNNVGGQNQEDSSNTVEGSAFSNVLVQALQNADAPQGNAAATTRDKDGLLWMQLGTTSVKPAVSEPLVYELGSPSGSESAHAVDRPAGSQRSESTKPTDYNDLIAAASKKYGVSESLIKAVIDTESSFNPNVVSSAGAKGLMQLMDGTASGLGVSNSFDPAQNIDAGVRYLSYQIQRFNGNENMALAAYNAGPGRVQKLGVHNDAELMNVLDKLPVETQKYITKIQNARAKYME